MPAKVGGRLQEHGARELATGDQGLGLVAGPVGGEIVLVVRVVPAPLRAYRHLRSAQGGAGRRRSSEPVALVLFFRLAAGAFLAAALGGNGEKQLPATLGGVQ